MLPQQTQRLVLRRVIEEDLADFHAYRNDPKIACYQGWVSYSLAEAAEFIRHHAAQPSGLPGQWLQIAIALRETGVLIGDCGVLIQAKDVRQATFGFTLARAYHRRGYAVEALSCLFDCLFRDQQLHRVIADTDVENTAAWTLAEQLGMRREGHLRQSLWFKGRWADEYLYAILHDEWMARQRNAVHTVHGRG